ncbi:hypothetical protein [Microcoleus vaginatus]|uniref:hypothetical protein n=1 Tax=Microcoleus vaginatus TaxID=119532 RepID=UPI001F604F3D
MVLEILQDSELQAIGTIDPFVVVGCASRIPFFDLAHITPLPIVPYLKLRQTAQIASIDPIGGLNLIKSSKTETHRL